MGGINMKFWTWTLCSCIAAFTVTGLYCNSNEYWSKEGLCCSRCRQGTYIHKDCTEKSGTDCWPCKNKTYMDKVNFLDECYSCSSCGQGLFALHVCTATKDTVCDASEGYFCKDFTEDSGCSLAQKHRRCSPGYRIKVPGTSRADTVCEPCPLGSFSQDGVKCSVWTICSKSQVELQEGSATRDVVCGIRESRHRLFLIPPLSVFISAVIVLFISVCVRPHCKKPSGRDSFFTQDPQSRRLSVAERFHQHLREFRETTASQCLTCCW